MDSIINFRILGEPVNWLIVTLVLVFVAYGAFAISNHAGGFLPKV